MDLPRTPPRRGRRATLITAGAVGAVSLLTLGLATLRPAAPVVDRAGVFIDTVRRGPMVRDVRGNGTLVPLEPRWIVAPSEGRVERVGPQPGATVSAETVLVELRNPEIEAAADDARLELEAAEADEISFRADLDHDLIEQRAAAARLAADLSQATLEADANDKLARDGLVSGLTNRISQVRADELKTRAALERERLQSAERAAAARVAARRSRLAQLRGTAELRRRQADGLRVRSGIAGVLQQLPVQPGQLVTPGTVLARVADPGRLKAELRIPETQARDLQAGLAATVDTRHGLVRGRVVRVDPAVREGTVTVDVAFDGPLPRGARLDLSVEGVIEIERLPDVLFVGRPAFVRPGAEVGLYRLDPSGEEAERVVVRLGRSSANHVEVLSGLREGDRVILSDTSPFDAHRRVRVRP